MSDMPEQIWYRHTVGAVMVERPANAGENDACYVRQDIHDAALAEKPKVRPLDWMEWPTGTWKAEFMGLASYRITQGKAPDGGFWIEGRVIRRRFKSLESAQNEVNSDFEKRILSALQGSKDDE